MSSVSSSMALVAGSERLEKTIKMSKGYSKYKLEKCTAHSGKKTVLEMTPSQVLSTELNAFTASEIERLVMGRSRPFNNVIQNFRCENQKVFINCSPLAIYIKKNYIRVEIARAACFCRHVFYMNKNDVYAMIRDSKIKSLDIQVVSGCYEMFEFLALTLPGVWCQELLALNLVFDKEAYFGPLTTLLKKTRNLSRLRVSHNTEVSIPVSYLIGGMVCLEELELNCPDNTGSGYHFDKGTMDFIMELDWRTGGLKPFRSLKAFNTTFDFNAEQFMKCCIELSMLSHNQTYEDYETIYDIQGRGGIDLEAPGNTISFEVTPRIPKILANDLYRQVFGHSKSYLIDYTTGNTTPMYFMIDNCMFRLLDYN